MLPHRYEIPEVRLRRSRYLPVVFAYLFVTNANTVGNGQPVLTGPGIVNKGNASKVAALAKKGTR